MEVNSGTTAIRPGYGFDEAALQTWLQANLPGFAGPMAVAQFRGGQSNPTFLLTAGGRRYVLRRKPMGDLLPSAHAVDREFRVIQALASTDVPVAHAHALCEDPDVIGSAFYVMDHVEGRIFWDPTLPGMDPGERSAIFDELNRVQAALHRIDPAAVKLGDYGRPGAYLERQVARWTRQYKAAETETIEAADRLIEWLPRHMPAEGQTRIVHGDYRLDNVIFHPTEPRILAVLDWELSTLGHPLADFSYNCMAWHIPPGTFRGIGGLDLQTLGIPSEEEYIRLYCERTGLATPASLAADWNFYLAYNMFRIAAILQGIAKRVEDGTASSEQARASGAGARPMAELAWRFAQQH